MPTDNLLDELAWRGLVYQHTDGVAGLLARGPVSAYIGFDPTGSSLHVGSLVQIMVLVHLQRFGHRPIALVGGGTGMIGDPSGKTSERQLLTAEIVAENTRAIRDQLARFLSFEGEGAARMRDNAAWLGDLTLIDFLRDTGKHFTVNYMLQKESVKSRMDAGISFTEFAYMLLQGHDFLQLHERDGVTLQLGGSDQWGNITAGIELIRRAAGAEAHALTVPLLMTSSGSKFGKTEAGAVWLDAARTSPYAFYQFWLGAEDLDVVRYLKIFTLLPRERIEELQQTTLEHPESRLAQRELARDVTRRVHGDAALAAAEQVSGLFFGGLDPRELSAGAFAILRAEAPFHEVSGADVAPEGEASSVDVLKLLVASGLAASNGAAKRLLEQGAVSVNRRKLAATERLLPVGDLLLRDRHVLVGKGKRDFAVVRLTE
ncbi:MAG: Tyrosyl-tRNA synthetase [Gemmatimonadetes bacterium]|jgi:tyrosyl-tRNA synthetase|nr:Tyrosyl-tRNA synthetase [Gemmatimonadota bacterium]